MKLEIMILEVLQKHMMGPLSGRYDSVDLACAIYSRFGKSVDSARVYAKAAELARQGKIIQRGTFYRARFEALPNEKQSRVAFWSSEVGA